MALLLYLFIFKYCIGLDIAIISLLWILVCEKAAYVENYETGHKYGTISYSKYSERAEWYYNVFFTTTIFLFWNIMQILRYHLFVQEAKFLLFGLAYYALKCCSLDFATKRKYQKTCCTLVYCLLT